MTVSLATVLWMYGLAAAVSMFVAVVVKLIVVVLAAVERKAATAPATAAAAPAATAIGIPPDHLAAITAAIYATIGAHRILHIEDRRRHDSWSTEGRLAHHHSHAIDHHPKR